MVQSAKNNEDMKRFVRGYMLKLVSIPGVIVSIVAFLLGYFVKDVAYSKAYMEALNNFSAQTSEITSNAKQSLSEAQSLTLEVQKQKLQSDFLQNEIDSARKEIKFIKECYADVKEKAADIKQTQALIEATADSKNIIDSVERHLVDNKEFSDKVSHSMNQTLKDVLNLENNQITFTKDVLVPQNVWGDKNEKRGFNKAGPHINISREATCSEGQYVTGIKVDYGGTCNKKCDEDGGVVANIILTCRSL